LPVSVSPASASAVAITTGTSTSASTVLSGTTSRPMRSVLPPSETTLLGETRKRSSGKN
jgi:hypothetical protein